MVPSSVFIRSAAQVLPQFLPPRVTSRKIDVGVAQAPFQRYSTVKIANCLLHAQRPMRVIVPVLSILMTTLLAAAAAAQSPSAVANSNTPNTMKAGLPATTAEYLISPDDVLNVYVLDVPELSRTYRVGVDGTVVVPLVDKPLPAAGMTLATFSASLENALRSQGLVSTPHVSTSVEQSRLHAVAITGAVKKPQIYQVLAPTTLLDLLSQAEGLADDAGSTAIIYRGDLAMQELDHAAQEKAADDRKSHTRMSDGRWDGASAEADRTVTVDLKRLLETGAPDLNVAVYPGDRITVPRAGIVYVVGAVNRPGGFPIRNASEGMTVLQAVAMAEDLKATAVRKKAMIIRKDTDSPGGRKQIEVNLKKVLGGSDKDPVLQAEDILFVPDSSSARALRRGAEAAIQAATYMVIYHPF